MTTTSSVTLGDLVEDCLSQLYRETERPAAVVLNSGLNASQTSVTLSDATGVAPTSVLEFGSELMLVTAKTTDPTPVLTVIRGYAGSTAASHDSGTVGNLNPYWARHRVISTIQRAFDGPLNTYLPYITSVEVSPVTDMRYCELTDDVMDVLEVRYLDSYGLDVIGGWRFEQNLPTSVVSSGKALVVPSHWVDSDTLIVTVRKAYSWTGSGEDATVDLPVGSQDLPPLYAAARLAVGRELSRSELDKVEEWNNEQATRSGFSTGLIRLLWQDFYRRLDESRKVHTVPRHRPWRRMPSYR